MRYFTCKAAAVLSLSLGACVQADINRNDAWEKSCAAKSFECTEVSGSGTHYFQGAVIHSVTPTPSGFVQRSTDTIDLSGDLRGRLIYHPVSVFDFDAGTLVNTGQQVFSGTVLDSQPVLLFDDTFRFDVNLNTGETTGTVHLDQALAGENIECHLEVVGTGMTEQGDARVDYTGICRIKRVGAGN